MNEAFLVYAVVVLGLLFAVSVVVSMLTSRAVNVYLQVLSTVLAWLGAVLGVLFIVSLVLLSLLS